MAPSESGAGLIPAEILAALERLLVTTRKPLAGQLAGGHRSRRYGSSLDFADFREYQPGDDFRRIDYLALARLDQLLLRLYDAEDDLTVRLVIDTSASMGIDQKLWRACQLAGAIGFAALSRRDSVTLHTVDRPPLRFSGPNGWPRLETSLMELQAHGVGSLPAVASTVLSRSRTAGLTVLCSDLLDPEWRAGLRRLPARGAELAVLHVLSPHELEPDMFGDLDLVDVETGSRSAVSLTAASRSAYQETLQQFCDDAAQTSRGLGASYQLVSSADDLKSVLLTGLRTSEILR